MAALLAVLAMARTACQTEEPELAAQDVVVAIPWTAVAEARYRILDDDEVKGEGVLRVEPMGERLRLRQGFTGQGFQDTSVALVDGRTLKPLEVTRVLSGPDGERRWEAHYTEGLVRVYQRSGDEERTDRLPVPEHAYDKWSEIFLWRTLDFRPGYRAAYTSLITADLDKPKMARITLEVVGQEVVEVPAGSFRAWRLEIRQSGQRKQIAWIAVEAGRELVRYDNGFQVFDLEELHR
jgi:hypothetical protein